VDEVLSREIILRRLHEIMPDLRERYGVERMALYGSFARDIASSSSDVDLLVEFGRPPGLEFVRLADLLENKLGRPVDLATFDSLHRSAQNPRKARVAEEIERSLVYV
jgi:predicted nucleotidyltransferase